MKKDAAIEIKGIYRQDGDEEKMDFFTVGTYYKRKGKYYIAYDETEMTGMKGTHTVVTVEDGTHGERASVTLRRTGSCEGQLIVESGVRHQCLYDTDAGALTMGVSGDLVESGLTDDGGNVKFSYSLDINTLLASENTISIHVRTLPPQENAVQ